MSRFGTQGAGVGGGVVTAWNSGGLSYTITILAIKLLYNNVFLILAADSKGLTPCMRASRLNWIPKV